MKKSEADSKNNDEQFRAADQVQSPGEVIAEEEEPSGFDEEPLI